jgi:predicted DNA-binding protein
MYSIELPKDLLVRLHRIREQTGKPIAHQVREAVDDYCSRQEGSETRQQESSC